MKTYDWFNIVLLGLFIYHFTFMDYNDLHTLDIIASVIAVIWLIITTIDIIIKWRFKKHDKE
ncbi:hypothetical protein D1839_16375 [Roseburia sp. 1XD42-34]|nr:hypothetical protein [Roseburia sp. 1XD42-34]RKI75475.1 hypothetical protein D7V87_16460 [Clostridium sp. 1xD42-85]